jgi:heat shock protein HtpX
MPALPIEIPRRRSVAIFALFAILMVILSYVLLLAIAAVCVYLPYLALVSLQSVNVQVLLIFLGGVLVAGALVWSLVPRRDHFNAPGLLLDRSSQPALFQEIEAIASALNEQIPREVYLVGQPNAFVSDRGGVLGFGSRRVMGIGLPLLSVFSVSELRAVLAHEFAHFYSGDTSLAPWVYRTQTSIVRVFQNLEGLSEIARVSVIHLLMAVVTFIVKQYFVLFLRVIRFISRKQEFRSDELACLIAGTTSGISGLEKIHCATVAWTSYWNTEVVPAIGLKCLPGIAEGFRLFAHEPTIAAQLQAALDRQKSSAKTSPYDSHPPLPERIKAMQSIESREIKLDARPALSLLEQPLLLEQQFIEQMNPRIPKDSLRHVTWTEIGPFVTMLPWRSSIKEYGAHFVGKSIASLPELAKSLPEIVPDPKGRLLDRRQRSERGVSVLVAAVGLALLKHDWRPEAQPGRFYLHRGSEQLNVSNFVSELVTGKISPENWLQKCRDLGIADLPLVNSLGNRPGPASPS